MEKLRTCKAELWGLALLGTCIVLVLTASHGPRVSSDSANYIAAAQHMLAGHGYLRSDGTVCVNWPPLFPGILALSSLAGLDPVSAARYINAAVFGLIIAVSGLWLLNNTRSRGLAIFGSACILFSMPLVRYSGMVLTEAIFALLVLAFLWSIGRWMAQPALKLLLLAAALAALACMTRYIGVTVILTGTILIVLNRRVGFGRRMASAAAFCGIAMLPLAGWLARNWLLTGTLAGERFPSSLSLLENVSMAGASVLDFFFSTPRVLPAPLGVTIFGLFAAVLFAPALFLHYRQEEGERERAVPL
ncbi:MAG: glycosyltransferase family 39 protein, partial [Phycisphaerae bacterium]|nr:glycosyltransferase family 39 protein [Phycisphaerae bacterium]